MFAVALATMLAAAPARAQERDSAAVGKITLLNRKAVDAYQHLEFEAAMKILNDALDQADRAGLTQHPIRARTFVTLGIVSLGGFKQRDQAVKYFRKALQIQPEVRLSPGLANPEIQAAFDEAIAALGSGSDLPPEKALVHEPVRTGQAVKPVAIAVTPDKDLDASAVVLRYRAPNTYTFTDVPMQKRASGAYEASIPASATRGDQVLYFIEARRANGTVIVARGSAAEPLVVALAGDTVAATPAVTTTATGATSRPTSDKRLFVALLGGAGLGWVSGTGEGTRNGVVSSGVDWTPTGQLAPELGVFVTPSLMLGVQGRLQLVRGATAYRPPNPDPGECGDQVCSPATGAIAALAKVTWFLADSGSAFQPYLSLSAGGGTIRHVSAVRSPATCGSGTEPCKDTVAGGPVLFGPGVGFRYGVSDAVGIVAEIGGLVGVPNFTANADLNIGVAFQL
jgi:hypothetical protein